MAILKRAHLFCSLLKTKEDWEYLLSVRNKDKTQETIFWSLTQERLIEY